MRRDSKDSKLFTIVQIPEDTKRRIPELQSFSLYQNMGDNYISAIMCSIIHYCINRNLILQLNLLISPKRAYTNPSSKQIAQIISNNKNSISFLFDQLQKQGLKADILLIEFCSIYGFLDFKKQPIFEKLAKQLDLQIEVLPINIKYGNATHKILLFEEKNQLYFILPTSQNQQPRQSEKEVHKKSKDRGKCCKCFMMTMEYYTPPCKHFICLQCIEKGRSGSGNYTCHACGQVILKRTIEQFQAEQKYKRELEQKQSENRQQTEKEQYLYLQQEKQIEGQQLKYPWELQQNAKIVESFDEQNKSASDKQSSGQPQKVKPDISPSLTSQIIQVCDICKKDYPYELFKVQECNHQSCFSCMTQSGYPKYIREKNWCVIKHCAKQFTQQQYEEYINRLQQKSKGEQTQNTRQQDRLEKKQEEVCASCYRQTEVSKVFMNDCGHCLCNKCILSASYLPSTCKNSSCCKLINTTELQLHRERILIQCDRCKTEFLEKDLFKSISCNHNLCFDCINSRIKKDFVHCIEGCSRMLFGKRFEEFFEQQQLQKLQDQEIEIKQQEDMKKQQALIDQNQKQKLQEQETKTQIQKGQDEKQQSKEESKSVHTTSKSQHLNTSDLGTEQKSQRLVKISSVQQLLNPEDSLSKIAKDTLNSIDKKQTSERQLSTIKDEHEEEKKSESQKQKGQSKAIKIEQKQQKQPEIEQTLKEDDDNSSFIEENPEFQQILLQNMKFQQEKDKDMYKELTIGQCTMCFSEFSSYNLRQPINCKTHSIGVCCIKNFDKCPQCEKNYSSPAIRVKQKLVLQQFQMQEEFAQFEERSQNYSRLLNNNYFDRINSPTLERSNHIYKENLNHLPLPSSYGINDRVVGRYASGVTNIRNASMDPTMITRSYQPPSQYQTYRRQQIGAYH